MVFFRRGRRWRVVSVHKRLREAELAAAGTHGALRCTCLGNFAVAVEPAEPPQRPDWWDR